MHCTAGLFGGDTLECSIHVEAGARVLVTQQSATKVHPSQARIAVLHNRIRVDAGGELHMHCEPVIPFAQSRLSQTTVIDLERGARLSFWESLMAGRVGRGEVWQFDELSSEIALNVDSTLVYLDRFRLSRRGEPPVQNWAMGKSTYLGTALHYKEGVADWAECLHDKAPAAGVDSPATNLTVMRTVGEDGPEFRLHRSAFVELALGNRD
jgi:urease accessory protein